MTTSNVRVEVSTIELARALRSHLQAAGLDVITDPDVHADFLITTVSDCSPACCMELAAAGVSVIVLAPVPRASEGARYAAARATYLPMTLDPKLLATTIARLEGDSVEQNAHSA